MMNRTFIRSNEAAKLTGISRARIYQDMRRGVLSVSVDAHGKVQLDVGEVARVYDLDPAKLAEMMSEMPSPAVSKRLDVLKFSIELLGIQPPIWREVLVPARYTFWELHVAIQDAMGWLDYHLHAFHVQTEEASPAVFGIPLDEDSEPTWPGWEHSVVDYVSAPDTVMRYDYDFGDGWTHSVRLLSVEPREIGQKYPRCTAGKRACPPEDCGGVTGYTELVYVLLDPSDDDHEQMMEWIPQGWMPEMFDPSAVRFSNPKRRWKRAFGEG
jgi:hypothetical protein